MSRAFYHDHPEILQLEAEVRDARPGAILVERSPFFPGGGGQLPDQGVLRWSGGVLPITGLERDERGLHAMSHHPG